MSQRVDRDVALYINGMNDQERMALASLIYFNYERIPNGDDTDQINAFKKAIDAVARREK